MMLAARGAIRASGAGLPYDAEVEYLESSGTQYIDTGFKANTTTTRLDIELMLTQSAANMGLFGSRNATGTSSSSSCNAFFLSASQVFRMDWANGGGPLFNCSQNTAYSISITGGSVTINGSTTTYSGRESVNQENNFLIFSFTEGSGVVYQNGMIGRVFGAKIYSNGVLVRDYIPVRKKTVGYLYDRVSGKLFGNEGSGALSYGSDVVQVEYLEGTGTQYIDTGVGYFADFEISVKMRASLSNITLQAGSTNRLERISSANSCWRFRSTDGGAYDSSIPITELHTVAWRGGKIYSDGVEIVSHVKNFPTQETTVFGSSASQFPSMVYALNMWDSSNALVRKFLPVRVGTGSTWEGAMIDTLTRRIYRNAGTGAFSYGNDRRYPIPA